MSSNKIIVCAVDFSESSECAIAAAAELARKLDCVVELVHVYHLPVLAMPDGVITATPTYVANITTSAQAQLDQYREQLASAGVLAGTSLLEGQVALMIVQHAEKLHATMIVQGTHGRSNFQRLFLGSTSERVLRLAPMPVLTVRLSKPKPSALQK